MWTLDERAPVPHWRLRAPGPATQLIFTTRRGGVSRPPFESLNLGFSTADDPEAVRANRVRLLAAAGLSHEALATAGQVHGTRVVRVTGPGHQPSCDALVTDVPGLALAVTTADCMSILYEAPGAVAAAHSGWRGTSSGMPAAALATLCGVAGCPPAGVRVHFGPCIRGCCYEVGSDVAARFPAAAIRVADGRPRLDLPTAARLALESSGVPPDAIHDTGACAACEPHWYFSHRRDQGATGRMWGVAALRHPGPRGPVPMPPAHGGRPV